MATESLSPTSKTNPTSGYGVCHTVSHPQDIIECRPFSSCVDGALDQDGAELGNFSSANQGDWDAAADLKVQWKIFGTTSEDTCTVKQVKLEYSLNGGSGWTPFTGWPKNATGSSQTGTATMSGLISTSQNLANVRIRMMVRVASCDPCDDGGGGGFHCEWFDSELQKTLCYNLSNCDDCAQGDCSSGSC